VRSSAIRTSGGHIASRTLCALVTLVGLGDVARAQTPTAPAAPDPAVEDASEANLESTARRQGLTFTAAIGPGLLIGFGIDDSVGRGGSLMLRLGHVATRRTVITFEVDATAVLHKAAANSPTETNTNTNLATGAQYYVNPSLWLRVAGGAGLYSRRDVMLPQGGRGNTSLVGPVLVGGLGFGLLRFKWSVLGLEVATSMMINRDGVLVATGVKLALSLD
jgi:hypothetical protein